MMIPPQKKNLILRMGEKKERKERKERRKGRREGGRRCFGPSQKMLWSFVGYPPAQMMADRSRRSSHVVGAGPLPCWAWHRRGNGVFAGVNHLVSGEEGSEKDFSRNVRCVNTAQRMVHNPMPPELFGIFHQSL